MIFDDAVLHGAYVYSQFQLSNCADLASLSLINDGSISLFEIFMDLF